jgi:hypothetical protein
VAQLWQEIEGKGHFCHWWQDSNQRRITAMTDILTTAIAVVALLAGFAALILFTRRDSFAGPGTGYQPSDELGPLAFRRRPA